VTNRLIWALRVGIAILIVAPIALMIGASLSSGTVMRIDLSTLTLQHYETILGNDVARSVFTNSLAVSGAAAVIVVLLTVPTAYAFSRYEFPGREILFLALLLVWVVPQILVTIPFFTQFVSWGLTNRTWVITFFAVLQALPLSTWMLRGYLEAIPKELDEAALVDGANLSRLLRSIILPVSVPCVIAVALYTFLMSWELFLYPLVFISDASKQMVGVGVWTYVGQFGTSFTDMMAYSFLMSLPVFAAFLATQRYLVAGLTAGASKG